MIEHVENPEQFIRNCIRSLKPNGSLFVSTMNRTKKSYAMSIVGAEYILRMLPPGWRLISSLTIWSIYYFHQFIGTHDWSKFLTPDELKIMIESGGNGAKVVLNKGLVLQPSIGKGGACLTWQLSSSDLDVNYITHAVKYT